MSRILSYLKGKAKYILGIAAVGTMLSFIISPTLSTTANGPQFNFMAKDYELFRGANITKNENVWKDPVSGEAGDVLNAMVYYHNGVVDTIAENTRIKVTIPAETTNGTAKLTASIMADNATTVTDTVVDGHVVGASGLTFNLDKDSTLELVPGSVKWYPNNYEGQNPNATLLYGQTGSEITSASGLKVGDIQGCFEYAGFVTFRVKSTAKVIPTPESDVTIAKTVKNITKGDTNFSESVNADPGDKVEFRIKVDRTKGDVTSAVLSDQLPSGLTYVNSSAQLLRGGVSAGIDGNSLLGSGINVGPLSANLTSATVTFDATVSGVIKSSTTLTNWATLVSCGKTIKDSASVVIQINEPGEPVINKSKSAFNETQNVDATKVTAKAGDVIRYTLITSNTGGRAATYTIEDGINDILDYADVTAISNYGVVINGPVDTGNDAKLVRYPAVEIAPSQIVTRTFTVKVKNPIPTNAQSGFSYDHKMYNKYGNDVVILITEEKICPKPVITLEKGVRNVSRGEINFVSENKAYAGEKLEYNITFKNTGASTTRSIVVYDVLPANVSLADSKFILRKDGNESEISGKITDGYEISGIGAGESVNIRFYAQIASGVASGESLKNTAILKICTSEFRAYATTLIEGKEKKIIIIKTPGVVTTLPKTGAAVGIVSLFGALFTGANIAYFKQKRMLKALARAAKAN